MDTRRHAVPIPSGPVGIVGRPGPRPSSSAATAVPADVELYAVLGED